MISSLTERYRIKSSAWFWLPLLLMISGFIFLHSEISIGLNPDLTAYFAIARHYSRFQITEALNAYWSPMISWLMVPFFWLKIDPILALRLLMLLTAIGIYWKASRFVRLLTVNTWLRFSSIVVITFLNLYYALSAQTPDFLSVFFTLLFIEALILLRPGFMSQWWLGATILFCFFSKSFLLPFSLGLLLIYAAHSYWLRKNAIVIKRLKFTFVIVFAGLFCWAGLMKLRYDKWMLSSAYAYNTTVFGPQGDKMHYTSYASLIDPPSEHATLGWQDPTFFKVVPVYFWASKENFINQAKTWKRNLQMWPYLFRYFSWFSYGLLVLPFGMFLFWKKRQAQLGVLLYSGFVLLLCAYTLVFIKERYLAPAHYLIVLAFIFLFDRATKLNFPFWGSKNHRAFFSTSVSALVAILFLIGFAKNPIQQIRFCMNEQAHLQAEADLAYELAMTGLLDHSRVATFTSATGLYNYMPLACFLSEASFFGELTVWKPAAEQEQELIEKKIDFFFYNNCSNMDVDGNCLNESIPSWLEQYPVVYENRRFKVKILDLRNPMPMKREDAFGMSY